MKKFVFVLTLVAVASLSFCQNPVGAWKGKLNVNTATMPKASTPEQQKMIDKLLAQVKAATLKLDMKANKTFAIQIPSIAGQRARNAEGKWSQSGRTITLITTKEDGKPPKDKKPQKMIIDASGKKMSLTPTGSKQAAIIFTR